MPAQPPHECSKHDQPRPHHPFSCLRPYAWVTVVVGLGRAAPCPGGNGQAGLYYPSVACKGGGGVVAALGWSAHGVDEAEGSGCLRAGWRVIAGHAAWTGIEICVGRC